MKQLILLTTRRLLKQKLNLGINLFGLCVGLISFLFIAFWVISENSFDKCWDTDGEVYRVALDRTSNGSEEFHTAMNYFGAAQVLKNEIPEIEAATNLDKDIITVFTSENSVQNINMFFTDSSFFKVFSRPMECDDPSLIFNDIHNAAISRSLAKKLFGNQDALNQSFKLNEGWEFNVVAIFDDVPENSHIQFDLILQRKALHYYMRNFDYATGILDNSKIAEYDLPDPYSSGQWKSIRSYTYLKLKKGSSIEDLKNKYQNAIAPCIAHLEEMNQTVNFDFQDIKHIHLHSNLKDEMLANGSYIRVLSLGIIGLLLFITSILNYINTSLANSINGLGIHKIQQLLGAPKWNLFVSYFTESLIVNVFVGIISMIVTGIVLHHGAVIAGFKIFPVPFIKIVTWTTALILVNTLLASVYLFVYALFSLQKLQISGKKGTVSANTSMKGLVVFQFTAAVFLIIGTIVVYEQLMFMQNKETGMDMDHTMVTFSPMTMINKPDLLTRLQTFRNEVQKINGVKGFTTAEIVPGDNYKRLSNEVYVDDDINRKCQFASANIDYDYCKLFSIKPVAGELFEEHATYNNNNVIINQLACEKLGLSPQEAIGKILISNNNNFRIQGVVNDYHQLSFKDAIEPVMLFNSIDWFRTVGYYYIKISPEHIQNTVTEVKGLWKKIYPQEELHFNFLDDRFNAAYSEDTHFGQLFLFLSILTIVIACLGLFSLSFYTTKLKVKEIGIRKVNGAKITEVMTLLNREFVKWVILSFLIASPLGWFLMNKWLQNFAYKTETGWWIFAVAGLATLSIALLTVSWQSWKAATRNPVEALRHE